MPLTQWGRRAASTLVASKQLFRWLGVFLSGAAVLFAFLSYCGFWSSIRGDDLLAALSDRFDKSYGDVNRVVKPHDREWRPLLRVIKRYTHADLLQEKEPMVFARGQAIASFETPAGEWTAPTTPIVLMYRDWPAPGTGTLIKGKDFVIVGTLADLHDWIRRDQSDFDFFWRTLIFGSLSFCIGIFLALPDSSRH
jgi:hypothetical protein